MLIKMLELKEISYKGVTWIYLAQNSCEQGNDFRVPQKQEMYRVAKPLSAACSAVGARHKLK